MGDMIINEIIKELNWKERIEVKLFKGLFIKIYGIATRNAINQILK